MAACSSSVQSPPLKPTTCPPPSPVVEAPPQPAAATAPSIVLDCGKCEAPIVTLGVLPAASGATIAIELAVPPAAQPDAIRTLPCIVESKRGDAWLCKPVGPTYCKGEDGRKDGCIVIAHSLKGDQAPSITFLKHVAEPVPATMQVELHWSLCAKENCTLDHGVATLQLR